MSAFGNRHTPHLCQLSLSALLCIVGACAVLLYVGRLGLVPFISFGLPAAGALCMLPRRPLGRRRNAPLPCKRDTTQQLAAYGRVPRRWHAHVSLIVGVLAAVLLFRGHPADEYSWVCVASPIPWLAIAYQRPQGRVNAALIASWSMIAYLAVWCGSPLLCTELLEATGLYHKCNIHGLWLRDTTTGMVGLQIPPNIRLIARGPNTVMIRRYLPTLGATWEGYYIKGRIPPYEEGMLFDEVLPSALQMLPTEGARVRVLQSLCCNTNYLRWHQALTLALGYAMCENGAIEPAEWWCTHKESFAPCGDPVRAAKGAMSLSAECGLVLELLKSRALVPEYLCRAYRCALRAERAQFSYDIGTPWHTFGTEYWELRSYHSCTFPTVLSRKQAN